MQDSAEYPEPLRLFPEKLFYKIGEASTILKVEPYVLRYWESEFPFLKPRKSRSGQRIYSKSDIDLIFQIKKLLYEEKYTINGVRRKLGGGQQTPDEEFDEDPPKELATVTPKRSSERDKVLLMVKERLKEILLKLS